MNGEGDGLITGTSRSYLNALDDIRKVVDVRESKILFSISVVLFKGRTIFIADTMINELPTSAETVEIAIQTAAEARKMGHVPRVAKYSAPR